MAGMYGTVDRRSCGHLQVHAVVYLPVHREIARWLCVWCEDDSVAALVAATVTDIARFESNKVCRGVVGAEKDGRDGPL
jgi:hypothetical protein